MELPLTRTWNGKPLSVMLLVDKRLVTAKIENPDGGPPLANMLLTLPNVSTRAEGFLHAFYVNPRNEKTADQAQAKGLGKAMLCAVVRHLEEEGDLQDSDVLTLEASGGDSTMEQRAAVKESDEELIDFLDQYPDLLDGIEDYCQKAEGREIERADLVEVACNVRENKRLVEYYKTYGFTVVPGKDRGYVTEMTGTVGGILGACKPKGGKTRRAYSAGYIRRRARGVRARTKRSSRKRNTRR